MSSESKFYAKCAMFCMICLGQTIAMEQNNSDRVNKLVETIRELGLNNIGDTKDTRSLLFETEHGINVSDIEAAWKIVREGMPDKGMRDKTKSQEINQSGNIIKNKLKMVVENQFSLNKNNRRWEYSDKGQGINDGAEGFLYFPKNLKTEREFLDYIDNAKLPRARMTLKDYLTSRTTSQKSLIIGSGLLQEMLQPTLSDLFKDSYFIDPNDTLFPDMIDMFGDNPESYSPFYGQFDSIYFDYFPYLYSDKVLTLATALLKTGGTLKMTYRPSINGLDLTKEENDEITRRNQGLQMRQADQKFENAKPIIVNAICNKLKNIFNYRSCEISKTKMDFRENGMMYYEIDAKK